MAGKKAAVAAPEPVELEDEPVEIGGVMYQPVADISAWFISQQSARIGGGLEVKLGVPSTERAEVFSLMDTVGEMLHFVVFRRVIDSYELEDTDGD